MIVNKNLPLSKEDISVRLDKFISKFYPDIKRSLINEAVRSGNILVNDKISVKGRKLKENDRVFIAKLNENNDIQILPNNKIKLDIIYEDDDILVLNKPAGIPVHPIKSGETDTLVNGLIALYPELANVGEEALFPSFVHRLDNDTSGVIVAAKNVLSYKNLREQFKKKKVRKSYIALVRGNVKQNANFDVFMAHNPKNPKKMMVVKNGSDGRLLRAVTRFKIIKRFDGYTLLDVEIDTGVMHQIRCQLASLGHPVAGDKVYGCGKNDTGFRHFLHASKISFTHPKTGCIVKHNVDLPDELKIILKKL